MAVMMMMMMMNDYRQHRAPISLTQLIFVTVRRRLVHVSLVWRRPDAIWRTSQAQRAHYLLVRLAQHRRRVVMRLTLAYRRKFELKWHQR